MRQAFVILQGQQLSCEQAKNTNQSHLNRRCKCEGHISTHPHDTSSLFDLDLNRRKETDEESQTQNITRTEHHFTVLNTIAHQHFSGEQAK